MSDAFSGYGTGSQAEQIEALQGHVRALEITLIQMMRVISRGQQGEEAYQALAQGLLADANVHKPLPLLSSKATAFHLHHLSQVFGQSPQN